MEIVTVAINKHDAARSPRRAARSRSCFEEGRFG
jgi:hypothetical protein